MLNQEQFNNARHQLIKDYEKGEMAGSGPNDDVNVSIFLRHLRELQISFHNWVRFGIDSPMASTSVKEVEA